MDRMVQDRKSAKGDRNPGNRYSRSARERPAEAQVKGRQKKKPQKESAPASPGARNTGRGVSGILHHALRCPFIG